MSKKGWVEGNIFEFKKLDGAAYLAFYILIPVIVTIASLNVLSSESIAMAYCYMTILISSLNSIYDAGNRWDSGNKSIRNTKIFIILSSNVIISGYCFWVIMQILITESTSGIYRWDWILCLYFIVVGIALGDIVGCFASDMALRDCVEKGDDSE